MRAHSRHPRRSDAVQCTWDPPTCCVDLFLTTACIVHPDLPSRSFLPTQLPLKVYTDAPTSNFESFETLLLCFRKRVRRYVRVRTFSHLVKMEDSIFAVLWHGARCCAHTSARKPTKQKKEAPASAAVEKRVWWCHFALLKCGRDSVWSERVFRSCYVPWSEIQINFASTPRPLTLYVSLLRKIAKLAVSAWVIPEAYSLLQKTHPFTLRYTASK